MYFFESLFFIEYVHSDVQNHLIYFSPLHTYILILNINMLIYSRLCAHLGNNPIDIGEDASHRLDVCNRDAVFFHFVSVSS